MNANGREEDLGAGGAELLHRELVYKIVGCVLEVHKTLGHGLREKTYERALCIEFRLQGILFSQQSAYGVHYKGQRIDDYVPDLEVGGEVIVETKVADAIVDEHVGQVLNYLRVSGKKVGLIINFKHPKLEWKRVVLETAR